MTEYPNIDELLNAYLDGELSQRQIVELHRLIKNDPELARRLRQLEKVKNLVTSLPRERAPEQMLEDIKTVLEKRSLLSPASEHTVHRKGAKYLLARKVLSAAAMIALVAGLLAVIYSIVAPENAADQILARKEPTAEVPTVAPPVAEPAAAPTAFTGIVELKTTDPTALKKTIETAITAYGIAREDTSPPPDSQQTAYSLTGSPENLALLLTDLSANWGDLDSASLYVVADRTGTRIAIENVTTAQIAQIITQADIETQIKAARYFAVVNTAPDTALTPPDVERPQAVTIPKPVLTSPEKPATKPQAEKPVTLTIVITPAE